MTLYPTHTCFTDALEMLGRAVQANPGSFESGELRLVHAICVAPDGHEYSHAWVESEGKFSWFMAVVDGKRQEFCAHIEEYYAEYNIKEFTKYTPPQAWEENRRSGHYGPWEERYRKLCSTDHKIFGVSRAAIL